MTNKMKILVLAFLVMLGHAAAQGQSGQQNREQVRTYLEQNDELLERAREAMRVSDLTTPIAELTFSQAAKLQESAWDGFRGNRYAQAYLLARQARDQINAVLAIARQQQQEEGETVVYRRLERAADILDRAGAAVTDSPIEALRNLLETANSNLRRAWEFYRNGQYRPALKLADQAERNAQKILKTVGADLRDRNLFEQRRDNAIDLLERARATVADCESEGGRAWIDRSTESLDRAIRFQQDNRPQSALKALKSARDMAQKALSECQGPEHLSTRHERLRRLADQLLEQSAGMPEQTGEMAGRLIEQAHAQLALAREKIDRGELEAAAPALQAAELALRQAQKYIEGH